MRDPWRYWLGLLLAWTFGPVGLAEARPDRSVLLITADDQGRDMGAYGNTAVRTPHLDGLAARGVLFNHAYAVVSSCSPSRAVILTGLHGHTSGQYGQAHAPHNFSLLPWVQPVTALLGRRGYVNATFGKVNVNPESRYGFAEVVKSDDPPAIRVDPRDVQILTRKLGEFLGRVRGKAFFVHLGFFDTHRTPPGFGNDKAYGGVELPRFRPEEVLVPPFLPDLPEVRRDLIDYYQSLSRLDQGVGMALQALEAAGRAKDTLIIYASDNGMAFPGAKTNLYDPGVRLPFLVASPAQKKRGRVSEALVSFVDVVPTVLDWTATEGPAYALPGRSLLPILEEDPPTGWEEVYFSHSFHNVTLYYPMRGIRTRRYKYIINLDPQISYRQAPDPEMSPTWQAIRKRKLKSLGPRPLSAYFRRPAEELYDLESDPNEVRNLAGIPRHASLLRGLRGKVQAFRGATKDPWLKSK